MATRTLTLLLLALAVENVSAQKPVQPFCSNNPLDKLPPCTAASTPAPVPASPVKNEFPFPGDKPANTGSHTGQFPFPQDKPATQSNAIDKPATPPSSTADKFPFPGEDVPAPVIDPAEKPYQPDPPPASSSSGSTPDDPPPVLKDEGTEGTSRASRRKLPKVEDLGAREEEDVRVARYYFSTGNYQAAYNRAKDAVRLDPTDAEAHLALAQNAQRLAKRDEAVTAYARYLELTPDGHDAKLARKALAELH